MKQDLNFDIEAKNPAGASVHVTKMETIEVFDLPKIDANVSISQREVTIGGVVNCILSIRNMGEDVALITPRLDGEIMDPLIVDWPLKPGPTFQLQWEKEAGWPKAGGIKIIKSGVV